MKALIQKLVEATGPSGHEQEVRELVRAEIAAHADELQVDPLGNLIARKNPSRKGAGGGVHRLMLAAHMDEIGLMVTHVDDNGYARFTSIGGVYPRHLNGGRVRFMNGAQGVIGTERTQPSSQWLSLEKHFIDLGANSSADCPVRVGDVAAFERPLLDLGGRLAAKAMDDRVGVAVLVETLKRLKKSPYEVYFVFSVQEEVGLRGATTAAYAIEPEIGLAVDVTDSGDTPKGVQMEVALGKGPAIKVRDGGMLSDPRVVDWLVSAAQGAGLPYQLEVLLGGTTDARAMQVSRTGVPTGALSIPCRYVHSPSEMVDYQDVQNAVQLLLECLARPLELP
jgi:endoglucanase